MPIPNPLEDPYKDPGPYSAIFPYDQLKQEEEERKRQLQAAQQKIMRTNAVGDALRLLIDSVGGSMGATITPKAVNPGIIRASDRMRNIQTESDANLERLRLQDLAAKQKDLEYQTALEAEARAAKRRQDELTQERNWKTEDLDKELKFRSAEADKSIAGQKELENIRGAWDVRKIEAQEKMRNEAGGLDENNPYYVRWRTMYGKKSPYMTISDTENGATIPLTDGQALQILKWMRQDPAIPMQVKVNISPNDLTNNLVFKQTVSDNWDRYKGLVRKMVMGEKISPDEEKAMFDAGNKAKRTEEYNTKRSGIDITKKKGAKELEKLNKEYADILGDTQTIRQPISLKPEESAKLQGVINAQGYSGEQKRSAVYGYLIKQGYDPEAAKSFAEFVYQNLK